MTEINVTFNGDAADKIIRLSQELGLTNEEVVKCLIHDGIQDKWCRDIVLKTLADYEEIYRDNLVKLMERYSELVRNTPENEPYPAEYSKRQVLNEAMTYDTRIEALKDVKDCLKVRGVFA